jgi:sRNA-binding protein
MRNITASYPTPFGRPHETRPVKGGLSNLSDGVTPIDMMYRFTREETEDTICKLAEAFPKCFFEDPQLRRPLKKNILVDLEQAGFPAAHDLIRAALDWYESHFGYLYALHAGAKRIDLNGKEVGTVTELEQAAALKKITEGKKLRKERNGFNATKTVAALHAAGRIPDDQLRKLDAPPMPITRPPTAPELKRVHEALAAAESAWTGSGDANLRAALTSAALGIVMKEAQSVIDSFTDAK